MARTGSFIFMFPGNSGPLNKYATLVATGPVLISFDFVDSHN